MMLQMFASRFTRESEGDVAVMTDRALAAVPGDMIVASIALRLIGAHFRRRGHDLIFQIGTRLHGGSDIERGMFLIDASQDGCDGTEISLRVGILDGIGSAAGNSGCNLLRWRSQQPIRYGHKEC